MVFNDRCFYLAEVGRAQEAIPHCDKAVMLAPDIANILDSRAYANFRLGQFASAIKDYDAAININPKLAGSLYGRGVAKLKLGDPVGKDDIEAAKALTPAIVNQMTRLGVEP